MDEYYDEEVEVPIFHFRHAAKAEYTRWRHSLVREFVQNSVDAGASEIHFNTKNTDTGIELTVIDNGQGMSIQECRERLLVLGGTHKKADAIGGFGVAKQILYFAWTSWSVRSQDYIIEGRGKRFRVTSDLPYIKGVTSIIHIDKEEPTERRMYPENFFLSDIFEYAKNCETTSDIFIDGTKVIQTRPKGESIRSMGWATLYKEGVGNSSSIVVRVKGVYMFSTYTASIPGNLTLELDGHARDKLTSNRDDFKSEFRDEYHALLRDIAVNTKSALLNKDDRCLKKFVGTGATKLENKNPLRIESMEDIVSSAREALKPEVLKKVVQEDPEKINMVTMAILQDELSNCSGRPDILVKTIGGELPKKHNPNTWAYRTESIVALWHLSIKQVLLDNKVFCQFGIGITLDPHAAAEFLLYEELPYFLINPEKWLHKPSLAAGKWLMVQELKQKAIHEIGHFASGTDHNETFVSTCMALEANTWKSEAIYRMFVRLRKIKFAATAQMGSAENKF